MNFRISGKAAEDMELIWLYTCKKWSQEQADNYVNLILDKIEHLAENPNSGRNFSFVREDYRYSKVKSHLIFYRTLRDQNSIEIVRVLHEQMDLERHITD